MMPGNLRNLTLPLAMEMHQLRRCIRAAGHDLPGMGFCRYLRSPGCTHPTDGCIIFTGHISEEDVSLTDTDLAVRLFAFKWLAEKTSALGGSPSARITAGRIYF